MRYRIRIHQRRDGEKFYWGQYRKWYSPFWKEVSDCSLTFEGAIELLKGEDKNIFVNINLI